MSDQSITIRPGVEVQVSDPHPSQMMAGKFPRLLGQEFSLVPDPESSAADLEYLSDLARDWAKRLEEASWIRASQEDSEPYQDAG